MKEGDYIQLYWRSDDDRWIAKITKIENQTDYQVLILKYHSPKNKKTIPMNNQYHFILKQNKLRFKDKLLSEEEEGMTYKKLNKQETIARLI